MQDSLTHKVALIGNPNSGKSSLFNILTGLNQKIGNFPGVTVDKKSGQCILVSQVNAEIIDLPGTYSLYPKSEDERVVFDILMNEKDKHHPDTIVVVADASNLSRNLLLFTQLQDLGLPMVLALTMIDVTEKRGLLIDIELLKKLLGVPVIPINARTGAGVDKLKAAMMSPLSRKSGEGFYRSVMFGCSVVENIKFKFGITNDYKALLIAHRYNVISHFTEAEKLAVKQICEKDDFQSLSFQAKETVARYEFINKLLAQVITRTKVDSVKDRLSSKIDAVLTHKIWGYAIFFATLFILFQAVFAWASLPMEWIDMGVSALNGFFKNVLPAGPATSLFTDGLIAGLGGVLIFIPQIAILFAFISVLEESGYMARVMFIMDKLMRNFGLNGKSVVPLVSSVACAVPAIMSARSIDNVKERLITIFVTPLISCSARIPVFTVLIALVVPQDYVWGIFNLQGLALMGLYAIGFIGAIFTAKIMQIFLKTEEKSYFIMEMPDYKTPRWKNVGLTIIEKVRTFVFEAGKVIIAISIILWALASYGPGNGIEQAKIKAETQAKINGFDQAQTDNLIASYKLEESYAGKFGKFIEPSIKPLGFDWKIGIALITSFAAREVFIGTMSTIYSIGSDNDDENTIIERMKSEINPETGKPMYSFALAFSLIIFYVFAMQCMSTIAVVYRETKSWFWPTAQFVYMTGLAYLSSFLVFQLLG